MSYATHQVSTAICSRNIRALMHAPNSPTCTCTHILNTTARCRQVHCSNCCMCTPRSSRYALKLLNQMFKSHVWGLIGSPPTTVITCNTSTLHECELAVHSSIHALMLVPEIFTCMRTRPQEHSALQSSKECMCVPMFMPSVMPRQDDIDQLK